MNILVTGSSGFVGSRLSKRLIGKGHRVVGIDRDEGSPPELSRFVHGDLAEEEALSRALDGVDAIFHLAAAKDDWGIDKYN